MSDKSMTIHLKIWRQARGEAEGRFADYTVENIPPLMSFLEMLDVLNEDLVKKGEEAVEFDNDCREGICGTCGMIINGVAHGAHAGTTTCEVRMRSFKDGETITLEPFRAGPFPIIKDLIVDRDAFDRIQGKGGFVSSNVGSAPLHRLRRLRGGLSQRLGFVVRECEDQPVLVVAPGGSRAHAAGAADGGADGC